MITQYLVGVRQIYEPACAHNAFLYRGLWILFCEFKLFDAHLAWLKFNHQFGIKSTTNSATVAQLRYQPHQLITEDERETHRWLIFTSLLILQRFLEWDALGERGMENKIRKKPKQKWPTKLRLRNFLWQRKSRSKSEKCNRLGVEYTKRLRLESTKFLIICMFMNLFFRWHSTPPLLIARSVNAQSINCD